MSLILLACSTEPSVVLRPRISAAVIGDPVVFEAEVDAWGPTTLEWSATNRSRPCDSGPTECELRILRGTNTVGVTVTDDQGRTASDSVEILGLDREDLVCFIDTPRANALVEPGPVTLEAREVHGARYNWQFGDLALNGRVVEVEADPGAHVATLEIETDWDLCESERAFYAGCEFEAAWIGPNEVTEEDVLSVQADPVCFSSGLSYVASWWSDSQGFLGSGYLGDDYVARLAALPLDPGEHELTVVLENPLGVSVEVVEVITRN